MIRKNFSLLQALGLPFGVKTTVGAECLPAESVCPTGPGRVPYRTFDPYGSESLRRRRPRNCKNLRINEIFYAADENCVRGGVLCPAACTCNGQRYGISRVRPPAWQPNIACTEYPPRTKEDTRALESQAGLGS